MRYNLLGKTGLFVSEMCLGTMGYGANPGPYAAAGWLEEDEAEPIFHRAFDAGINFLDTANVYANGLSEEITGRAVKKLGIARHDVVIATKFEHAMGSGPNDSGASRQHIMKEAQASLKRLGTDYIDLYQMHGWDPATPLEETIRALEDMVRQGYVRYIGISNWSAWQIVKALGVAERLNATPFHSLQAYYSLATRDLEREVVPMLEAEKLGLLIWSPLAGGYLSGKYRSGDVKGRRTAIPFPPIDEQKGEPVLAAIEQVASAHGVPMAAVALAWLLHQKVVTSVILGVKRIEQLEEHLKAGEVELSADDLKALDEASAISPEYPGWMMQMGLATRTALIQTGKLPDEPQY